MHNHLFNSMLSIRGRGVIVYPLGALIGLASLYSLFTPYPYIAVCVPLGALVLWMLALYPVTGFFAIIFLIPMNSWRSFFSSYHFLSISKFLGVIVVLIVAFHLLAKPERLSRFRSVVWLPITAFFAVMLFSSLTSPWPVSSMNRLRYLLQGLSFCALTLYFAHEKKFFRNLSIVVVASTAISSLIAVIGIVGNIQALSIDLAQQNIEGERAVAGAAGPNIFATMIIFSLPFIVYLITVTRSSLVKLVMGFLFCVNVYAVLQTYSRAGYVTLAITIGILAVVFFPRMYRIRYTGFFFVILFPLCIAAVTTIPQSSFFARVQSLSTPQDDSSLKRRASYLRVAANAIKRNPLIGSGAGSFKFHYAQSHYAPAFTRHKEGFFREAHNTYLSILTGSGLLGGVCFLVVLLYSLRVIIREWVTARIREVECEFIAAFGIAFVSFLLSILFLSFFGSKYLWLCIGIVMALDRLSHTKETARV